MTIVDATFIVTKAALKYYSDRCFIDKTEEERKANRELLEAIQLVEATARVFCDTLRKFHIINIGK